MKDKIELLTGLLALIVGACTLALPTVLFFAVSWKAGVGAFLILEFVRVFANTVVEAFGNASKD
jgi:hypothetical protein